MNVLVWAIIVCRLVFGPAKYTSANTKFIGWTISVGRNIILLSVKLVFKPTFFWWVEDVDVVMLAGWMQTSVDWISIWWILWSSWHWCITAPVLKSLDQLFWENCGAFNSSGGMFSITLRAAVGVVLNAPVTDINADRLSLVIKVMWFDLVVASNQTTATWMKE